MAKVKRGRTPALLAGPLALVAMLGGVGVQPASAAVTALTGSAYGYRAYGISLFGGAQPDTGPNPSVTLTSSASNSPQVGQAPSGTVVYGPAYLLTTDAGTASSAGNLGAVGSVTSSATLTNVNKAATQLTVTGSEILTADTITSVCRASESGTTANVTIANGTLQTDTGWDDGDAVYPEPAASAGGTDEHDRVVVALPANPTPGLTYSGHIHLNGTTRDDFHLVFNEQVTNPDGSLSVSAVHEYFDGPTLLGHLVLGRTVCGVTAR